MQSNSRKLQNWNRLSATAPFSMFFKWIIFIVSKFISLLIVHQLLCLHWHQMKSITAPLEESLEELRHKIKDPEHVHKFTDDTHETCSLQALQIVCFIWLLQCKWLSLEGLVKESSRCWSVQTGIPQFVVLVGAAGCWASNDPRHSWIIAKMLTFCARFLRCLWKWRGSESLWKRSRSIWKSVLEALKEDMHDVSKEGRVKIIIGESERRKQRRLYKTAWVFEDSPMSWVCRKIKMLKSRSLLWCSSSQPGASHSSTWRCWNPTLTLWPFLSFWPPKFVSNCLRWNFKLLLSIAKEWWQREKDFAPCSWSWALWIVKQWES